MNIEKNYELRKCGDKLVLRGLCLSDKSYEMKTVLVADELVDEKNVDSCPFFVLRQNKDFVLCWEVRNELQISKPCCKYLVHGETVLFQKGDSEPWYMCTSSLLNEPIFLGFPIGSFMELFVEHTDTGFMLHYFEGGVWCSKTCSDCEVLDATIEPEKALSDKMFANVLKIKTEEGELYLSIKKEFGPSYRYMGSHGIGFTQSVSYNFIFSKES